MNTSAQLHDNLIAMLCDISDPEEMSTVLTALLTSKELEEVARRVEIFRLLSIPLPQREIAVRLGVGIATVTRGAHAMKSAGAEAILEHLPVSKDQPR